MSHFSVLVVGDNPEYQLAPYRVFECTGIVDEYVQDVDITAEFLKSYEKYKCEHPNHTPLEFCEFCYTPILNVGEAPQLNGKHKYGYALFDEKGDLVKVISRTNPNEKWDYYELGGFAGYFRLLGEDTKTVAQAHKKDIDFSRMRSEGYIAPFAYVKDYKWFDCGEVGWFERDSAQKDADEWEAEFNKMLDGLPPDTLLSLYDCHI